MNYDVKTPLQRYKRIDDITRKRCTAQKSGMQNYVNSKRGCKYDIDGPTRNLMFSEMLLSAIP